MEKRGRPEACGEAGTIEEGAYADGKGTIVYLSAPVLRGAVRSGRYNNITKVIKY